MLLWGGWLIVTVLVISLAKGIIHPYYSVAAAPAIGAMVGIGASALWEKRSNTVGARAALAAALAATAVWSYLLLDRAPHVDAVAARRRPGGGNGSRAVPSAPTPPTGQGRPRARLRRGVRGIGRTWRLCPGHGRHRPRGGDPLGGPLLGLGAGRSTGCSRRGGSSGRPLRRRRRRSRRRVGGTARRWPVPGGAGHRPRCGPWSRSEIQERVVPAGRLGRTSDRAGRGGWPSDEIRKGGGAAGGGFLTISTPGTKLVKALETNAGAYTWVAATVNFELGRRVPARHRRPRHGDRRVQRHRPRPDAGAVRARRRRRRRSTTSSAGGTGPGTATARPAPPDRSPGGSRATSRPRRSTASPSTTSRPPHE